ncbi:kinase-like domain-containing protein [Lipomyces japonicus]|uniref:kinase-like domain-containing protein n=1 Tax=Lipomyces japonicus TaxID=56871 RepID=UPI0034CF99F0
MAVLLSRATAGSPLRGPNNIGSTPIMASASASASALSSPTSSVFSEQTSSLDDVRHWDEPKVIEWLRSTNFSKYARLFEENHINGEALLEVDQNVIKELGITKVGDRVRLLVAIKALRNKCFTNTRRSKSSIAQLDHTFSTSATISSSVSSPALPGQRPESPVDLSHNLKPRQLSSSFSTNPKYLSQSNTFLQPSQASRSASAGSSTQPSAAQPLQHLEQHIVRFIFQNHSKMADISGCFNAESIKKKGIRKFGVKDPADQWTVYVTTDVGSARLVDDMELMTICHTTSRPERERLILCKQGQSPSNDEYQKSIQISRDQLAREAPPRPRTVIANDLNNYQSLSGLDINNDNEISMERSHSNSSRTNRLRNFFGQRPPSELISSNLAEYFPGHESRVLEQTVRNSIRRSKRISGLSRRISVATTASYASSNRESFPPVPTVGDAWLNVGSSQNRRSVLPTSSPPSRASSVFKRSTHRSTGSVISSIDNKDFLDAAKSSFELPSSTKAEEIYTISRRPFPDFVKDRELVNSIASDNNSYIEVDNVDDIPEELSDAEDDSEDIDGGPTRWIKGALIGSGSFGSVVLGLNALTGELMAVKQVELTLEDSKKGDQQKKKQMIDALQREIQLLRDLHHDNIVQYLGSNSDSEHLNIFLEYVPGGSVAALLCNYGPFEEPLIRTFVRQILCGLSYLHDMDIIHRDIKGANVLVDNKGKIKISDFGISKRVEANLLSNNQHHRPSLQGSVYWMAPEVVKQTSYTRKADIWSLGCLVVEMFTGTHPFPEFSQMQALFKIGTQCSPEIPKDVSEEAKDFLGKTFELDFEKRPTAGVLLTHPFLSPIVSTRGGP